MRGALLGCWMLLWLLAAGEARSAPIVLGSGERYELAGSLEVLEDPSGALGVAEVEAAARRGGFRPLRGAFKRGYSRSAFWLRFSVVRTAGFPRRSWLRLSPACLEHIDLYVRRPGAGRVELGCAAPTWRRPMLHPEPVAPLELPQDEPVEIYLRLRGTTSIGLVGSIHTPEDFALATGRHLFFQSLYIGIATLLFLLALMVRLVAGVRYFGWFALFILSIVLSLLVVQGMAVYVAPAFSERYMPLLAHLVPGAAMGAFILFVHSLFQGELSVPEQRALRLFLLLSLLSMAAYPLGVRQLAPAFLYGFLVSLPLLFALMVRLVRRSPSKALVVLMSSVLSLPGYLLFFLQQLGYVSSSAESLEGLQLSTIAHLGLLFPLLLFFMRGRQRLLVESSAETGRLSTGIARETKAALRETNERLLLSLRHLRHLRRQSDGLNQFLLRVSHDYRAPLAVIRGALELQEKLLERAGRPFPAEFTIMRRAADRLEGVIERSAERVLRPEGGRRLPPGGAGLQELLEGAARGFGALWPEREFRVEVALRGRRAAGRTELFEHALYNLLDNARKYSELGTPVLLTGCIREEMGCISVENEAAASPGDELEGLFEQYRRGPNAVGHDGAGLGLWMVREDVGRLEGRVRMFRLQGNRIAVEISVPLIRGAGDL